MTNLLNNDDVTKPPTKPRRRLLRISLRTLLVLLTVGCVWLGWKVNKAQKQRAAVAWVEEMGGHVFYDYDLDGDPYSDSYNDPPGPVWLRDLVGIDCLSDVKMSILNIHGNATLSDVSPLADLTELQVLWLRDTPVTDLTPLASLTNLEYLDLDNNTAISDVTPLKNLTKLKRLDLFHTNVSQENYEILKRALPDCEIDFTPRPKSVR